MASVVCVDVPLAEPQAIDGSTSFREVESTEISLLGSVPLLILCSLCGRLCQKETSVTAQGTAANMVALQCERSICIYDILTVKGV